MNLKEFRRYCRQDVEYTRKMYKNAYVVDQEHIMRVLNKKYWPHHVSTTDDTGSKEKWCYENLKSSEWRNVGAYFAFKRSQDATLFALRWS